MGNVNKTWTIIEQWVLLDAPSNIAGASNTFMNGPYCHYNKIFKESVNLFFFFRISKISLSLPRKPFLLLPARTQPSLPSAIVARC